MGLKVVRGGDKTPQSGSLVSFSLTSAPSRTEVAPGDSAGVKGSGGAGPAGKSASRLGIKADTSASSKLFLAGGSKMRVRAVSGGDNPVLSGSLLGFSTILSPFRNDVVTGVSALGVRGKG